MVSTGSDIVKLIRTEPNEKNEIYSIEYTLGPEEDTFTRTVRRLRLVTRTKEQEESVLERKKWKRFGKAKGAIGPGTGMTMVSQEEFFLDDPLGEEAEVTGEDKLIERIKASVSKSRSAASTNKDIMPAYYYYPNVSSQTQQAQSRRSVPRGYNRAPRGGYGRGSSRWRPTGDGRTHTPGRQQQ